MANCSSCSAPLLANNQVCRYCGLRNDVDLKGKHDYSTLSIDSGRICPECKTQLQTIELQKLLQIERCQSCYGLFFDPGEIETLLDVSVAPVFSINLDLITNINQDRYSIDRSIKYQACPVCQVLMNRVSFGYRSGVVVDKCRQHGVWLGGGEISHLLEWKRAGGQLLAQQYQQHRTEKKPIRTVGHTDNSYRSSSTSNTELEALGSVLDIVANLFD